VHKWDALVKGFAVELTPARATLLALDPSVESVRPDAPIWGDDVTQFAPRAWGIDRIDERALPLDNAYVYSANGGGVHVYVIDSGIRGTHVEFGPRVSGGVNYVDDGNGNTDCNGHGTHVASTIGGFESGVAKKVSLHSVRVLGCDNRGWVSDFIDALEWVRKSAVHPAVVNMSIGADTNRALDKAVNALVASGVVVAVSAGNSDTRACDQSPARAADALTVAATTIDDERWVSSNYGTCVDLFAPGAGIRGASNADDVSHVLKTGTSMATPHVAGAAAKVLSQNPGFTPAQVRNAIINLATQNVVAGQGVGSPDLLLFSR
jgi:subtilisin family serine protease